MVILWKKSCFCWILKMSVTTPLKIIRFSPIIIKNPEIFVVLGVQTLTVWQFELKRFAFLHSRTTHVGRYNRFPDKLSQNDRGIDALIDNKAILSQMSFYDLYCRPRSREIIDLVAPIRLFVCVIARNMCRLNWWQCLRIEAPKGLPLPVQELVSVSIWNQGAFTGNVMGAVDGLIILGLWSAFLKSSRFFALNMDKIFTFYTFVTLYNDKLASCPSGPVTANGVDILTEMYVIY